MLGIVEVPTIKQHSQQELQHLPRTARFIEHRLKDIYNQQPANVKTKCAKNVTQQLSTCATNFATHF